MNNIATKEKLLNAITPILMEMGPKKLTMDYVAKVLSMSKRTLYEMFGSKENMIMEIFNNIQKIHAEKASENINNYSNAMEMMAYALLAHQHLMQNININFFRDMDERYPQLRKYFENSSKGTYEKLQEIFRTGVEQGVFIPEINYPVISRLFRIQMESLKRMEQLFPPEVTLAEAYNTIITNLLRGIATPKGLEYFNNIANRFNKS